MPVLELCVFLAFVPNGLQHNIVRCVVLKPQISHVSLRLLPFTIFQMLASFFYQNVSFFRVCGYLFFSLFLFLLHGIMCCLIAQCWSICLCIKKTYNANKRLCTDKVWEKKTWINVRYIRKSGNHNSDNDNDDDSSISSNNRCSLCMSGFLCVCSAYMIWLAVRLLVFFCCIHIRSVLHFLLGFVCFVCCSERRRTAKEEEAIGTFSV